MCGYYCIAFIDHMFDGRTLQSFNKMFSPTDFSLNDKITYDMFSFNIKDIKWIVHTASLNENIRAI